MGGMYPDNREIEIFGEQVSWPGMGADGKFTNGSFSDPMVKPGFIPAESINRIIDNVAGLVASPGGSPDNTDANQLGNAVLRRPEKDARARERGDESVLAETKKLVDKSLAELKEQIRDGEWPVGSLYIQHMNDMGPIERGFPASGRSGATAPTATALFPAPRPLSPNSNKAAAGRKARASCGTSKAGTGDCSPLTRP